MSSVHCSVEKFAKHFISVILNISPKYTGRESSYSFSNLYISLYVHGKTNDWKLLEGPHVMYKFLRQPISDSFQFGNSFILPCTYKQIYKSETLGNYALSSCVSEAHSDLEL